MDFTAYPNIQAKINELGGIKQTVFNKAELQLAEAAWQRVTPKELAAIDAEIPYAQKVMDARMCRTFVMPTAVVKMANHVFSVILVKDIVWVYPRVVKNSMNLIPTSKDFYVEIFARDGSNITVDPVSKSAFTKKNPGEDGMRVIQQVIGERRKGIIYGYSDEVFNFVHSDYAAAGRYVDDKSAE